jgi:hypothetical protein
MPEDMRCVSSLQFCALYYWSGSAYGTIVVAQILDLPFPTRDKGGYYQTAF